MQNIIILQFLSTLFPSQENHTVLLLLELFPPASPTPLMANIDHASLYLRHRNEGAIIAGGVGGGGGGGEKSQFHRQQQRRDLPYLVP
jgi:hypothetical protein